MRVEAARALTLGEARSGRMSLTLECAPCRRETARACFDLPARTGGAAGERARIADLWDAGRFRCAACRRRASGLALVVIDVLPVEIARWPVEAVAPGGRGR